MAILGGYFLKSMKNIVNNTNKIQYYSIDFSFQFLNPGYFRIETSLHLVGWFHAVDSATTRRSLHGSTRMPWATRWEHGPLKDSYISYEGVRIVCCHVRLPEYIYYVIMSYIYIHTCHICHVYIYIHIWVIPTSPQQKNTQKGTLPKTTPGHMKKGTRGIPGDSSRNSKPSIPIRGIEVCKHSGNQICRLNLWKKYPPPENYH